MAPGRLSEWQSRRVIEDWKIGRARLRFTPARRAGAAAFVLAALRAKAGGAEGVRTPDLLNAIQALYQLSYDPIQSELI
jgi:hypothetical protein